MLENLKKEVYEANVSLKKNGLVILTWGNVSGRDKASGYIAIKPSGVEYDEMSPDDIVIADLSGNVVEGKYKPSSDMPTHIELYKAFPEIGGIAHTHSKYATVFAQSADTVAASQGIVPRGTTHADYFDGAIPVTRKLTKAEINGEYEKNTGLVIVETFKKKKLSPQSMPACLVHSHGAFTWGECAKAAAEYAHILENVAELAYLTLNLYPEGGGIYIQMQKELLRKHFDRKHGASAYYGQKK